MITDILLQVLVIIISFVLSPLTLLPDATLPASLIQAYGNVQGFAATVNPIFPLDTLFEVLGVVLVVEVAIFGYKAVYWLIKKIPMIS